MGSEVTIGMVPIVGPRGDGWRLPEPRLKFSLAELKGHGT